MPDKAIYGLVGFPLGHSFSKDYFSRKFKTLGINAEYLNFEIPDIGDIMEVIAEYPGLKGFNVTIPYKEQILPYIDTMSEDAKAIGAVNTVKMTGTPDNPCFMGFNTDAPGFADDIRPILPVFATKALVLGSGGASKAVRHALHKSGIPPTVVSRTGGEGRLTYSELTPEVMQEHLVIVNTTPLGMFPDTQSCPPIPYDCISPLHVCYDVVYNPSTTLFMRKCAEHKATVRGGIGMLTNQAKLSWEIWNDKTINKQNISEQ